MMTIRTKLMLMFSAFAMVAVLAGSGLVLQKAITEKSSYVNELNSLLVPQFRSEVDQRLRTLSLLLNPISEAPSKTKFSKTQLESLISSLKSSAPFIEAIILTDTSTENMAIQILQSDEITRRIDLLIKEIQFKSKLEYSVNKFHLFKDGMGVYRTAGGRLIGLLFNNKEFLALTEYSRGKDSLIIDSNSEILFSNILISDDKIQLPHLNLAAMGANIVGTDLPTTRGSARSAFLTKSDMMANAYVMLVEDKVSWLTIASPLLNSTISVLFILVFAALIAALWIARSIAVPIEKLTEQTAKVGLGDWKSIEFKANSFELAKLTSAFNAMIDNLQKRERDLTNANQKLVRTESLAAVGRIGAGVAHEVKNPLASILSYAQLLEMQINTILKSNLQSISMEKVEKIKNYNSMVLDDTRRASRIINDLLTFARQKEIQTEKISVADFLHSLNEKFLPQCQQNSIVFESHTDNDTAREILSIDREQIYQVIYNLVQNAIHALADTAKSPKKITLSANKIGEQLAISIEDNGSGIAPEHLEKIFEPFFSTKKMGQGSGLGLAISYGIIQMHGGHIQVSSIIGQGTKFNLFFPIYK